MGNQSMNECMNELCMMDSLRMSLHLACQSTAPLQHVHPIIAVSAAKRGRLQKALRAKAIWAVHR